MTSFGALRKRPLILALVALAAVALLALACEEEEEAATPTPTVARTPVATSAGSPTPTAIKPGAAGIASNPRPVRGFEGVKTPIVLDDGLAMFKTRPASEDRTGVTATTIKFGRPTGITGFIAPYEPAWGPMLNALAKRVNDAGGIHGRKLEFLIRDDKSDPAVGVQVTRELIEGDKVFALFFQTGSPTHAAMHEYHVQQKVPNLFYLDASNTGQEPVTSKWDFAQQQPDIVSGLALTEAVYKQDPNAKVAIVYADFPASAAGRDGIRFQAQRRGLTVTGTFAHDLQQVDLTSVARQVAESGATWVIYHGSLIHAVSLVKALKETVGRPDIKVAQFGAVPGVDPGVDQAIDGVTMVTGKSPQTFPDDPIWAALDALAKEDGVLYVPGLTATLFGPFEHLVRALEMAGPDLTREGLIEALENGFDGTWQCNVCLVPTIIGSQDHWSTPEAYLLARWNNTKNAYDVFATESFETSEGLGLRGNYPGLECKPPSADLPKGSCPWKQS